MRELKFSDFSRACTRKGAALVSEKLVFHQPFGNRRAIQRDKGMIGARTQVMDRACEKLFSRAAFAEKQHCRIRRRHALRHLARVFHRGVFSDDTRKSVMRRVFFTQEQIFSQKFLLLRSAIEEQFQMIEIDRLLNEIKCTFFHRRHGLFHRPVGRNKNHRQGRLHAASFSKDVQSRTSRQL